MEKSKNLFAEFSPTSKEAWLQKLEKDLKGKPLEDLYWQLEENIRMEPFFHLEDAEENWTPISSFESSNDWEIGEDIFVKNDWKNANQRALHALEYGAEALRFVLTDEISKTNVATLLKGIEPTFISIHFYTNEKNASSVIRHFADFFKEKNAQNLKGSLNFNLGEKNQKIELDAWDDALRFAQKNLPNFKLLTVDSTADSVAVKDTTDTLKKIIQRGIILLENFKNKGVSISEINNQIQFSIPIGNSYFVEIAKIRALKLLWANVLAAYGISENLTPIIEAHLSTQTLKDDPHTNKIQATTQAMSAIIGGVNRLTILPSDLHQNPDSKFSQRIARNVQHLLKMESFMDRVIDPGAGSYYIEKLTERLAEQVWKKL